MQRYHKRLLSFVLIMAVLVTISASFLRPLFDSRGINVEKSSIVQTSTASGTSRGMSAVMKDESEMEATSFELPSSYQLVLENDDSELYFNSKDGAIAYKLKAAETYWFSNPQDTANETILAGSAKGVLSSQISLTYYSERGQQGTMNSANDCVEYDGLSSRVEDNTLTVAYQFGRDKVTLGSLPAQISAERFEEFLAKLSEKDQKNLKKYYTLATIKDVPEKVLEVILTNYPLAADHDLYYLNVGNNTNERTLKKIKALWDSAGYTTEDLLADNEAHGLETEVQKNPKFYIELAYTLDGETLQVSLDASKITHTEGIPIEQIKVLEYFGAGNRTDEGYLLLPDGSGALVGFNNEKKYGSIIEMTVYGEEYASSQASQYQTGEGIKLPVFGIQKGKEALFAEIVEGESKVTLLAKVAGISDCYNTITPRFNAVVSEVIRLSDSGRTTGTLMTETTPYDGKLTIRYTALAQEDSGYTGMATYYREQLVERGVLTEKMENGTYPLVASVVGWVSNDEMFLGLTDTDQVALTTYAQTAEIAQDLKDAGASGLNIRYMGWFNNGLSQTYAGNVRYQAQLGGETAFKALAETLSEAGIPLYPEVNFLRVAGTKYGYRANKMNIRGLGRDIMVTYHFDRMNRYRDTSKGLIYLLKPSLAEEVAEKFISKYEVTATLALGDLGTQLDTDFDWRGSMHREGSVDAIVEAAERLDETYTLMASNPNAYLLPYVDMLVDIPCDDSWKELSDEIVPFYQMVVHGYIPYATKSLNYTADYRTAFLQAIEFGAGLNYILFAADGGMLKETNFDYLYTGNYTEWREVVLRDYADAASVLQPLQAYRMTEHKRLDEFLYKTSYEDGTSVYINYADEAIVWDGVEIAAKAYKVVK